MPNTTSPKHKVTSFADATAVKALSSHTYEANFPDDWCIGSVPHGGYITSVFLAVAHSHFQTTLSSQSQPHTISLHLDFLRRTQTGPSLFTVTDTKLGRQTSIISITLTQSSRVEVICSLTQSNIATETGVTFHTGWTLAPAPLPVCLPSLDENTDGNWEDAGHMPFSEFRRATKKTQFFIPRTLLQKSDGQERISSPSPSPSPSPTPNPTFSDQWMRFASGEKWTNASLGYVVDMFTMPVEKHLRIEAAATTTTTPMKKHWYPTVLLNLDVKQSLPNEGVEWLFTRTTAKVVRNGRMDLEVVVLDTQGEVVALSHHVALAVGAERNLAERREGGAGGSKI